jgi:hypothetical protein
MERLERRSKCKAPWAQMSRCLLWGKRSGEEAPSDFQGAYGRHLKRRRRSASKISVKKKTPDLEFTSGVRLYLYFGLHFACEYSRLKRIDHHPRRHRCCLWVYPRILQNSSSNCFGTSAFHEPCFFRCDASAGRSFPQSTHDAVTKPHTVVLYFLRTIVLQEPRGVVFWYTG